MFNFFNNHINNIKEMVTYFKAKNNKSKEKNKKYKRLSTMLKSCDTFVINSTTSSSITLKFTGFGFIVIPISTGIACGLTNSKKVIYGIVMQKYNKYKKHFGKDQKQSILSQNYTTKVYKNMNFYVKISLNNWN